LGFKLAYLDEHKNIVKYLIGLYKIQHNRNKNFDTIYIYVRVCDDDDQNILNGHANMNKHLIKYLLSCGCHSNNYTCIIIL
jgi:predicted membrane protein